MRAHTCRSHFRLTKAVSYTSEANGIYPQCWVYVKKYTVTKFDKKYAGFMEPEVSKPC